ncbi:MAG: PepSY domain-containing protein, partial [Nevskiaceae bacterium]|nr:PepSY domain-containing protein [Nevskiaceae bacterium]
MNGWQRWLKLPVTSGFRRALFQVHLWIGIAMGLYVLMISLSGSAIVLRPQIGNWFIHNRVENTELPELTGDALTARISEVYTQAGYTLVEIAPPSRAGRSTYVTLQRDGVEHTRFFDQHQGKDLGSTYPWQVRTVEWLVRLHDDLLMGFEGKRINGVGGILFLVMTLSGLVLWWQGTQRWRRGLVIRRDSPRGFLWQLHNFIGFWALPLMLVWALTAIYFAWPEPFDAMIDHFDADLDDADRPDAWLNLLIKLHFG